jgi:hypothetical protein
MKMNVLVTALLCTALAVSACADNESTDDVSDIEAADGGVSGDELGKADALSTTSIVYTLRHDDRRCRFPICGGWWLSRVNFAQTRCSDGTWASQCYVGALDWTPADLDNESIANAEAGLPSKKVVLRGKYAAASAGEFGAYTVFKIREAYRGIGSEAADGMFYFLKDRGIRCITTPCSSIHQAKVNSTRARDITEVNLDIAGASAADVATAYEQLGQGRIIAAGFNTVRIGPGGSSVSMIASQVFVRVTKVARDPLACSSAGDCGLSSYPFKVNSAADCYCPTCPTPLSNFASDENRASWDRFCTGVVQVCPLRPCAAPPAVGCVAGQCGFDPQP